MINDKTILLIDDEPHYLDWLIEYLENKNYQVEVAKNLSTAISLLHNKYRVVIVDMNIPPAEIPSEELTNIDSSFSSFPGLYAAHFARHHGYRNRQVIIYTVHDNEQIMELAQKVDCTYMLKGRPREFKKELDGVLSFDPTKQK